jgi:hypothetical protein
MRISELLSEDGLPSPTSYSVRVVVQLYGQGMSDIQMARHLFPDLRADALRRKRETLSKHVIAVRRAIIAAIEDGALSKLAERIGVEEKDLVIVAGSRPRPNLSAAARTIVKMDPTASWSTMEASLRQWAVAQGKECHPHSISKAIQLARKDADLGERRAQKGGSQSAPFDPAARWRD